MSFFLFGGGKKGYPTIYLLAESSSGAHTYSSFVEE